MVWVSHLQRKPCLEFVSRPEVFFPWTDRSVNADGISIWMQRCLFGAHNYCFSNYCTFLTLYRNENTACVALPICLLQASYHLQVKSWLLGFGRDPAKRLSSTRWHSASSFHISPSKLCSAVRKSHLHYASVGIPIIWGSCISLAPASVYFRIKTATWSPLRALIRSDCYFTLDCEEAYKDLTFLFCHGEWFPETV